MGKGFKINWIPSPVSLMILPRLYLMYVKVAEANFIFCFFVVYFIKLNDFGDYGFI